MENSLNKRQAGQIRNKMRENIRARSNNDLGIRSPSGRIYGFMKDLL